jgi:hypothetical protein
MATLRYVTRDNVLTHYTVVDIIFAIFKLN